MYRGLLKLIHSTTDLCLLCFVNVFGRHDPSLKRLSSLPTYSWVEISRFKTLQDGTIAIFPYEHKMVKDAIYQIKNKRPEQLIKSFANVAADFLLPELSELQMMQNFTNPIIVSIPETKRRRLHIGFNPSALLAKDLAALINIPYLPAVLIKTRETKPQKELSRTDRLKNVSRSMEVAEGAKDKIKDRCVIVIDDVATTGATLREAKRALLASGSSKVLCLAFAH